MATLAYASPVGVLVITAHEGALTRLDWQERSHLQVNCDADEASNEDTRLLAETRRQLDAYFAGTLRRFDLPMNPKGNDLHQAVFQAMLDIPMGETRTYGEVAKKIGNHAQPVGQACGANPIPVIIPCHRILSATGLGGYSGNGGLETKIALLRLEGGYPFLL
ncbi:methylated-DNA--[protein]-cysteine S-methyltransferase [Roseibium sp. CAU 1637]|uniref:Methylated-DNA--[protein]-cysteine S-methyltransferase n=1 Tax=Roseibium limicola TaxID=2816037 RepID=A0A939J6M3_9HYPH|nr:methylated-DNA--[protein]-cysteine S-methyltransferase [Roseibium limicola]MBO0347015.1 methylated-DNA--[protein]-cysteine S-methyltransferase [Roseibium limicola]